MAAGAHAYSITLLGTTDKLVMRHTLPPHDEIIADTPLRLSVAAAIAFLDGIRTNILLRHHMEAWMTDEKFLTAEEVAKQYRGEITVGTLRNWRALRIGPPFVKIGKAVLYPVEQLDAWDQKNMVICYASKSHSMDEREGE